MSNIFLCLQFFLLLTITNVALSEYSAEDCKTIGFNKANLLCSTCEKLIQFNLNEIADKCKECCLKDEDDNSVSKRYPKAVLEVCACKFGVYPQIQAFVESNRPKKFKNLQIKYVRGLDPMIMLYDAENKVVDVLDIHKWDTDSVEEFLTTHLIMD